MQAALQEPRRLTPQEQLQAAAVAGGGPISKVSFADYSCLVRSCKKDSLLMGSFSQQQDDHAEELKIDA